MSEKYEEVLRQIQKLLNEALGPVPRAQQATKRAATPKPAPAPAGAISFNMNVLAFMTKYARGRSGPEKFTLLVAFLAKGDVSAQVTSLDINGHWNKMKTALGPANPAHGNRAKAKGWVEPVKTGTWRLTDTWKEALAA